MLTTESSSTVEDELRNSVNGTASKPAGWAAVGATSATALNAMSDHRFAAATSPLIKESDRLDIENFLKQFPNLHEQYIPVAIIGEGTFSTVYKAIDVQHHRRDNTSWLQYSRQDPEDIAKLFAHVEAMKGAAVTRSRKKYFSTPLNQRLKEYVDHWNQWKCELEAKSGDDAGGGRHDVKPHFVALKRINATSAPARIADEMSFLRDLGGAHNVVPIISACRHEDQVIVVFPLFVHREFRELLPEMGIPDIRAYMRLMFEALAHIHEHRVLHRDIKPSNFLFTPEDGGSGVLVDFGLAQKENTKPDRKRANPNATSLRQPLANVSANSYGGLVSGGNAAVSNQTVIHAVELPAGVFVNDSRPAFRASRAGTRGFRAPEVLFKCFNQTIAIDIWSAGVILLTLLTRRYPFFQSSDDHDAIVEIACLFGRSEVAAAASAYGRVWKSNLPSIPEHHVRWEAVVAALNPELASQVPEEAYDLLYRCLCLDASKRITAAGVLKHPFLHVAQ